MGTCIISYVKKCNKMNLCKPFVGMYVSQFIHANAMIKLLRCCVVNHRDRALHVSIVLRSYSSFEKGNKT